MTEKNPDSPLFSEFEASRPHLRAVAYRMLSSQSEADDAVQEAWLRVSRAAPDAVANPRGWLTTVVAGICLDMLRSRQSRREQPEAVLEQLATHVSAGPDQERLLADSVGAALMLVLETLSPNERSAFVLHDSFDLSFEAIGDVLGVTPLAARQLASRARRRVRGGSLEGAEEADPTRQRQVVEAFLLASRTGDLTGLMSVLHPGVVLRADAFAVAESARRKAQGALDLAPETRGAEAVASTFVGRASAAQAALIDGRFGAVWAPQGKPRSAFLMTVVAGRIHTIEVVAEPEELAFLDIEL